MPPRRIVLTTDLGGTLGEAEGVRGLACAELFDVEDEVLWEEFMGAPDCREGRPWKVLRRCKHQTATVNPGANSSG